jgi:hypothetical protein
MTKHHKFEMQFLDKGNFVKLMLARDEKLFCDYENEEAKPVRVRAPLPKKEKLLEMAKYWVSQDSRWESLEHWLNFYNECQDKEIFEQVQEIRKYVKRISQYSKCKKIAMDILNEQSKNV